MSVFTAVLWSVMVTSVVAALATVHSNWYVSISEHELGSTPACGKQQSALLVTS